MKKIFATLIVCFALFTITTSCTKTEYDIYSNISGTVIDVDNGEPIAHATVTLSPSGINTYTGSDGQFDFTEIDAQQYTITVQKTGYETNRKTITAPAGETVKVSMTMKKTE
ncbi:MAG: carboxypeptidase-like regulatory domain-containing protein [Bacteroidales bacterium]|nr:carboxypeptidase-like regulatory domain-containing protein [Bacteroidales bacterium]